MEIPIGDVAKSTGSKDSGDGCSVPAGAAKRRRGDVDPITKKVFWRYRVNGKESWITPERWDHYFSRNAQSVRRFMENNPGRCQFLARERRKNDPERFRSYVRNRRKNNPEKFREMDRKRYRRDWERIRERSRIRMKKYAQKYAMNRRIKWAANLEENRRKSRENYAIEKAAGKVWYQKYPDKYRKSYKARRAERRRTDPLFKFSCDLRARIHRSIKKIGGSKDRGTIDIIGCTIQELRDHIASQFLPGMSWQNHGIDTWHIDHKVALKFAKTTEEIQALWHYSNLGPLWAVVNLKKGAMTLEKFEHVKDAISMAAIKPQPAMR